MGRSTSPAALAKGGVGAVGPSHLRSVGVSDEIPDVSNPRGQVPLGRSSPPIDDAKTQLTAKIPDGPMKGKPIMGIYRRKGDRLEACYDPSGANRPKEFDAGPGMGFVLVTYRRREK